MANRLFVLGLILLAALLEAGGDSVIRLALGADGAIRRVAGFVFGALLLFGYGFALVSAPIDFGKLFGLYIAILFVTAQIVNVVVFKTLPTLPVYLGGSLIIAGGVLVTCWKPTVP